jgi:hypothetical protein
VLGRPLLPPPYFPACPGPPVCLGAKAPSWIGWIRGKGEGILC